MLSISRESDGCDRLLAGVEDVPLFVATWVEQDDHTSEIKYKTQHMKKSYDYFIDFAKVKNKSQFKYKHYP